MSWQMVVVGPSLRFSKSFAIIGESNMELEALKMARYLLDREISARERLAEPAKEEAGTY
jgi:hypothetical protein